MVDQNQNNSDFPEGFLIRDKRGQFKKVQDDKVVDFKARPEPTVPSAKPVTPVAKPPTKPSVRPQTESAKQPTPPPAPLAPQPPISSSDKAPLYLEPEDEEEIRKHAGELKKLVKTPSFNLEVTIESIIEKIIRQHNLHFENEVILKRFSKVIESRLRDIRDSIETEEVLTRSKKVGGLELPPDIVKGVMTTVEAEVSSLQKAGLARKEEVREKVPKIKPSEEKKEMFAPAPPSFIPRPKPREKIEEEPVVKLTAEEEKPEKLAEEIKQELEAVEKKEEKSVPPPIIEEEKPLKKPASSLKPESAATHELYSRPQGAMPQLAQVRQVVSQRPIMADIKQPVKVVGPVEELAEIDLKEFRRQGTNPQEATEKILEKIELLEEDSWQSKMDGIKAWKKSETNQLYLDIGRQSIESGKTVEEVIHQYQQENKPHLLMEEFLAINSLNSKLAI